MASGTAVIAASEKVIEKGREIAAHVLEAAVADIEFSHGRFEIAGTDRFIEIMELATMLRLGLQLRLELPQSLDVQHIHESSPSAFPNGCHIAEVEIDPETGIVEVVKYSMVNDFGVIVNPLLVTRQAHDGGRAGNRPSADGTYCLRRRGPVPHGVPDRLCAAARVGRSDVSGPQPSGTSENKSARCQRVWTGRLRRVAAGSNERCRRCAIRIWHPTHRYAGDPAQGLASDPASAIVRSTMKGGVSYLYFGDIRDKPAAGLVAGNKDPCKTGGAERPSACGIRDHDLTAAEKRIELAHAKRRLIAISARHNHHLM
jgi:hypothetical protein